MTASLGNMPSFTDYADNIMKLRYSHVVQGRQETWEEIAHRVVWNVMCNVHMERQLPVDVIEHTWNMIAQRKFIPGGRILSQAGRAYHQTDNCFTLRAQDTREGWANLLHKCTMMFMSGGGVGVSYDDIRPYGTTLRRSGGISSGPLPLIEAVNAVGAAARQGGERRGAIYASLKWDHADIAQFIDAKVNSGALAHTNISVRFNNEFLEDLHTETNYDPDWQCNFYDAGKYATFMHVLKNACKYGEPGFQFDSDDQILRNACTEIISADDCDSCCLGSVNFAAIKDLQELSDVTNLAILFLLCNTLYTDTPHPVVPHIKAKNRRLGLGIMGLGEWFIQRDMSYGHTVEHLDDWSTNYDVLAWLRTWQQTCDNAAVHWSNFLSVNKPVATRAIAPTGTISIAGGHTTPGIEPIFHTAYLRTFNTLKSQQYTDGLQQQKVVDPIVAKMMHDGYNVDMIDTAYTMSQSIEGIERRIAFQATVQRYVDNAISTTINLPPYVEGIEQRLAPVLLRYLPQLRGITFYPDGRYDNQPVQPIDIKDVLEHNNATVEQHEACKGGSCGI